MAAATVTFHNLPSDGANVARGIAVAADQDTISTGLTRVSGFVATAASADTVVALASSAAGVATVRVHVAGVPSAGTQTLYWKAWQLNQTT